MNMHRFDSLALSLAGRASRRSLLRGSAAGLGVTAFGVAALAPVAAQDATPAAPPPSAATLGEDGAFLFVQSAASGTFEPNPGAGTSSAGGTPVAGDGVDYLLTLEGHTGNTVFFSDRPERIFGEAPTQTFLDNLGFGVANPPNAALVAETEAGQDVVMLELLDPRYDVANGTVSYGAKILTDYQGEGLAHLVAQQAQQQDRTLVGEFTSASLFIDDCSNADLSCGLDCNVVGTLYNQTMCWDWSHFSCAPCGDSFAGANDVCNATFPACDRQCNTYWTAC